LTPYKPAPVARAPVIKGDALIGDITALDIPLNKEDAGWKGAEVFSEGSSSGVKNPKESLTAAGR